MACHRWMVTASIRLSIWPSALHFSISQSRKEASLKFHSSSPLHKPPLSHLFVYCSLILSSILQHSQLCSLLVTNSCHSLLFRTFTMRFFTALFGIATFAVAVLAQGGIQFTSVPPSVNVGQSYTITWSGGDSTQPVTIVLREGNPGDLTTVATITSKGTEDVCFVEHKLTTRKQPQPAVRTRGRLIRTSQMAAPILSRSNRAPAMSTTLSSSPSPAVLLRQLLPLKLR